MHARTEESRELQTQIGGDEAVVRPLAKPQIEGAAAEDEFMDCVSKGLAGGRNGLRVQGNDDFVDRLFPWFERPWPRRRRARRRWARCCRGPGSASASPRRRALHRLA